MSKKKDGDYVKFCGLLRKPQLHMSWREKVESVSKKINFESKITKNGQNRLVWI